MRIRKPITLDEMRDAVSAIQARGEAPTMERLRREIGRGSMSTLHKLRNQVLGPSSAVSEADPKAQDAFNTVWKTAFDAGRASVQAKLDEMTSDNAALSAELERTEHKLASAESELHELRTTLAKAIEDATSARKEASEAWSALRANTGQGARADQEKIELLKQIANLQKQLGDERAKAARLEGRLEAASPRKSR